MKSCRSCSNWSALEEFLDRIDPSTNGKKAQVGLCKRYAPRPIILETGPGDAANHTSGQWPRVASDDWCGEWNSQFS